VMGTAYQFKVKMSMGPKWGETQYSSEMDITTSETDTTEVQKLQDALEATLDGKIDAAKATLNGKSEEIEDEMTAAGAKITTLEMRGRKSSICGYQSTKSSKGTVKYDTVHTEVDEVNSVLDANTGIYTAGINGVYEISLSGYASLPPGGWLQVLLERATGYGYEDKYFAYSYSSRSNGHIKEVAAATRHVTLTAGQQISLNYDYGGSVYVASFIHMKFCVTLY